MDTNSFQVVITNQLKPEQDKNLITKKLAALFKIDEQKAAQCLIKPRTVIKDNLDEATAKKYFAAIQQTGAHCEIINKKDAVELPQIFEPARTEEIEPKSHSIPRPAAQRSQEPPLSLVAHEEKNQKETREKLSALQNASAETICPQCGTIRGSADAICLHCGYNPNEIKTVKNRLLTNKIITIIVIITITTIIFLGAGLPYYQKAMAHKKLEQDLKLAFDIRNAVTAFIEKTGFFPNQNMDANLPERIGNDSIESINIGENAIITVILKPAAVNNLPNQTIIFKPKATQGRIIWNCMDGSLTNELRPEACRN